MVLKNGSLEKSDKVSVKSYFILPMEICMLRIMMMKEKIEKKNMHLLPSTEVLISLRASIVSENVCLHLKFEIPNSLCIHQRGDNDVIVLIIFLFNNEETYKFFGLWNSVKH